MMFAKYFEYYTIILRGPFFRGHTVLLVVLRCYRSCYYYYVYENNGCHSITELQLTIAHWLDRPVSLPALYILSS